MDICIWRVEIDQELNLWIEMENMFHVGVKSEYFRLLLIAYSCSLEKICFHSHAWSVQNSLKNTQLTDSFPNILGKIRSVMLWIVDSRGRFHWWDSQAQPGGGD